MRHLWAGLGAVAVLACLTGTVQAWGAGYCCPPPCYKVQYVDKIVTCYKPQMVEKEVKCVVPRMVCKEVIEDRQCIVRTPVWSEVKHTINVCKPVAKEIERDVTCWRWVPVKCKDPCTGCITTCCKPQAYTVKVKCLVWENHFEQQVVTMKVCKFKEDVRTYKVKKLLYECVPQTVTKKVWHCVMVPYQTTVKVAVCVPCGK